MNQHQKVTQAQLVTEATMNKNQGTERIALFDATGAPITPQTAPDTGASVLLTGYTTHAAGAIAAGDSVNVALAKLEARLAAASIA
jgi:hypothetical protein